MRQRDEMTQDRMGFDAVADYLDRVNSSSVLANSNR